MKTQRSITTILAAAVLLALNVVATPEARTQTPYAQPPSFGAPTVLTTEQAQARTTAEMQSAMVATIGILERQFDRLANLVTGNPYHLTKEQVVDGFGAAFNTQVQIAGAQLLGTIIKANLILGRTDPWLEQPWVVAWLAAYQLDPATGEPLPAPTP